MADGDEVTIWSLKYWQTDGIASVKCEEIHPRFRRRTRKVCVMVFVMQRVCFVSS